MRTYPRLGSTTAQATNLVPDSVSLSGRLRAAIVEDRTDALDPLVAAGTQPAEDFLAAELPDRFLPLGLAAHHGHTATCRALLQRSGRRLVQQKDALGLDAAFWAHRAGFPGLSLWLSQLRDEELPLPLPSVSSADPGQNALAAPLADLPEELCERIVNELTPAAKFALSRVGREWRQRICGPLEGLQGEHRHAFSRLVAQDDPHRLSRFLAVRFTSASAKDTYLRGKHFSINGKRQNSPVETQRIPSMAICQVLIANGCELPPQIGFASRSENSARPAPLWRGLVGWLKQRWNHRGENEWLLRRSLETQHRGVFELIAPNAADLTEHMLGETFFSSSKDGLCMLQGRADALLTMKGQDFFLSTLAPRLLAIAFRNLADPLAFLRHLEPLGLLLEPPLSLRLFDRCLSNTFALPVSLGEYLIEQSAGLVHTQTADQAAEWLCRVAKRDAGFPWVRLLLQRGPPLSSHDLCRPLGVAAQAGAEETAKLLFGAMDDPAQGITQLVYQVIEEERDPYNGFGDDSATFWLYIHNGPIQLINYFLSQFAASRQQALRWLYILREERRSLHVPLDAEDSETIVALERRIPEAGSLGRENDRPV